MSTSIKLKLLTKGPSINYVVSKSAIFDPLLLVVFLLSKIGNFCPPPPPPLRRHSLWTAPKGRIVNFHKFQDN